MTLHQLSAQPSMPCNLDHIHPLLSSLALCHPNFPILLITHSSFHLLILHVILKMEVWACCPPRLYMLIPHVVAVRCETLGCYVAHENGTLMSNISALLKETWGNLLVPSLMWGYSWKVPSLKKWVNLLSVWCWTSQPSWLKVPSVYCQVVN